MRKEEKFLTDIKNELRSTGEKEENLIKYFLDRFRVSGARKLMMQDLWTAKRNNQNLNEKLPSCPK